MCSANVRQRAHRVRLAHDGDGRDLPPFTERSRSVAAS
jgi:hypothetical protein